MGSQSVKITESLESLDSTKVGGWDICLFWGGGGVVGGPVRQHIYRYVKYMYVCIYIYINRDVSGRRINVCRIWADTLIHLVLVFPPIYLLIPAPLTNPPNLGNLGSCVIFHLNEKQDMGEEIIRNTQGQM